MTRILVIAAHPDDEILGGGGTFIKHVKNGDQVFCLIMGEGINSRDNYDPEELDDLNQDCLEAGRVIGFKDIFFSSLAPSNTLDTIPQLKVVKEIEKTLELIKPEIIYTHHSKDLNKDHQIVAEAVMTACRPCNINCPQKIYAFETLSSTEWQLDHKKIFTPNLYVNIEEEIEDKLLALSKYRSEMKEFPHSRSLHGIKILSHLRGMQAGLKHAEAFHLLRQIKK